MDHASILLPLIAALGAGVVMKEGLSIRGLTTAASLWITAAIGILIGIEFYFPAFVATLFTLLVLSQYFEYVMTIRTRNRDNYRRLAESLSGMPQIREFSITPTGD